MKTNTKVYTVAELQNWDASEFTSGKGWMYARPYHLRMGFIAKCKAIWGVITGKYDVLDWEGSL